MSVAVTSVCQCTVQFSMRTRNNVNADQFANSSGSRGACVCSSLYRTDISANENGDITCADVFFADQDNVSSLDHCVSSLDRADKSFCLDHSESFVRHFSSCASWDL